MRRTLTTLTAAALAFTLALPAQAEEMDLDSVVATVNGQDITLGHMLVIRAQLPEQYQQLGDEVLWDGILDQIVQQTVLAQDDRAEETKRVTLSLDNERRSLLAAEVVQSIANDAVSDEAVQAAYDAEYATAELGKEFNASHILVETEEEAQALIEELNGGADFAELAKTKSTGPSGPNGGELGWFGPGMMVEPFQAAVEQMSVGDISAPVQTQFGWHVIKLNDERNKEAPQLEEVRADIELKLQQEAVQNYIDEKLGAAEVTRTDKADIDTSVLSNMQLLEE
ncbi:peptidylprolyl isomerase [Salipiger sp. HF18]|uniref:Parvulin-like PPIase n=1 Tax=Salipiger thiooxidans TaxID=282683 RepID=A0A1G7CRL3_9RHOB|nr:MULTISPECIES: peptidylprolyl isomerase [Salipiger]NIY96436.1 peptidylprolyl isomerase [Salipiger sp. HF18]SDE42064.1 peptidyl-prolyl cis-trans isomerase C [Salipiger thiooxidans]